MEQGVYIPPEAKGISGLADLEQFYGQIATY